MMRVKIEEIVGRIVMRFVGRIVGRIVVRFEERRSRGEDRGGESCKVGKIEGRETKSLEIRWKIRRIFMILLDAKFDTAILFY